MERKQSAGFGHGKAGQTDEGIVPAAQHQFDYELKYLDLVDANNGNAWVTASQDLEIYWPLPMGADVDFLKVLHFKDLHRDMDTGEIEGEIAGCEVESLTFKVENGYVIFEVGSGGFSPFALVWLESTGGSNPGGGSSTTYYTIDAEAGQGGEISPDGWVRVARGSDKTFTITPDKGYQIADVLVDGRSIGVVSRYTFENVRRITRLRFSLRSIPAWPTRMIPAYRSGWTPPTTATSFTATRTAPLARTGI